MLRCSKELHQFRIVVDLWNGSFSLGITGRAQDVICGIGHKTKRMLRDEPENNGTAYDIES